MAANFQNVVAFDRLSLDVRNAMREALTARTSTNNPTNEK